MQDYRREEAIVLNVILDKRKEGASQLEPSRTQSEAEYKGP